MRKDSCRIPIFHNLVCDVASLRQRCEFAIKQEDEKPEAQRQREPEPIKKKDICLMPSFAFQFFCNLKIEEYFNEMG
jgi:hypothetical protein